MESDILTTEEKVVLQRYFESEIPHALATMELYGEESVHSLVAKTQYTRIKSIIKKLKIDTRTDFALLVEYGERLNWTPEEITKVYQKSLSIVALIKEKVEA